MGDEVDLKRNLNRTSRLSEWCSRGRVWAMRSTSRETSTEPQLPPRISPGRPRGGAGEWPGNGRRVAGEGPGSGWGIAGEWLESCGLVAGEFFEAFRKQHGGNFV